MTSNRKRILICGVFACTSAACVVGCGSQGKASGKQPATVEAPTVAVAKAGVADLSRNLAVTAEFRPYQEVDVMAKVSGYIKSITVDIGDRVKQGQLLATLEFPEMTDEVTRAQASVRRSDSQVTQARDEVRRAESNYQIAHISFQRLDGVMKSRPGLVAQQEVDDAQAKDTAADAQVSAAKSNLASAEQQVEVSKAELARFQTMFEYTRVTAPFDGVVTKRYADTGSMIQAGTASQTQAMPVVRISQNSLLRLILPVPESAVPTVHVGQQVDVRVPTLNRTFPGRVVRSAQKLVLATRTMDTEVDVPNPSMILIPGMYAEVDLTLQHAQSALCVPLTAVDVENEARGKVMVVTTGNLLESRPVALGLETANRVEIRSGLRDGELVVIGSRAGLRSGGEVKPKLTELVSEK
jgi:RND family efflux transporter MFP subunit